MSADSFFYRRAAAVVTFLIAVWAFLVEFESQLGIAQWLISHIDKPLEGFTGPFITEFVRDFGNSYSLLAAFGFTLLAVYPIDRFKRRGWQIKKEDIFSSFSPKAMALYLKTFLKIEPDPDHVAGMTEKRQEEWIVDQFEKLYVDRYGLHNFDNPIRIFTVVTFIAMYLLSNSAIAWLVSLAPDGGASCGVDAPCLQIPQVAAAGIGGAYLWIVSDMIARERKLDLKPGDILNASLRLAMAAALAVAVAQLVTPLLALPIAFGIGAFPLETVRVMLRRIVSDKLGLPSAADSQSTDQVLNLDSIDHPTADKLQDDANITTMAELAYADPVQLSMRTGLGFDFVIDIVSQALAWLYFGDRLDDLRSAGLRGAMEVSDFLEGLASDDPDEKALADAVLAAAPTLPQDATNPPTKRAMTPAQFLNACDEIANDPYTSFLVEFWRIGRDEQNVIRPNYVDLLPNRSPPT